MYVPCAQLRGRDPCDGSYTGCTPDALATFVAEEVERLDIEVPVFLGLDHGGPWVKDAHVSQPPSGLDAATAMTEAKRSVAACIEAGYDLLHLDFAAGPLDADAPLPIDTLIDRTVILLHHAESVRRAQNRAPVAYEVDTDEARGGLQDEDRMRTFPRRFRTALDDRDLPDPSRGSSSGRCFPIADGAWCVLRSGMSQTNVTLLEPFRVCLVD